MQNQINIETENKNLIEFLESFSKTNKILRDSDLIHFATLVTASTLSSEDAEILKRANFFEWYRVIKEEKCSNAKFGMICVLLTHDTNDSRSAFIFASNFGGHSCGSAKIDKENKEKLDIIGSIRQQRSHYLDPKNLEKIPTPKDIEFLKSWGI